MKSYVEIGRGSQYKVYDMGDGRVLKIPLCEAETYTATKYRLNQPHSSLQDIAQLQVRVQTLMNAKARIAGMITHQFTNAKDFLRNMGNPVLIDNFLPEDTPEKRWGAARIVYTQNIAEMTGPLLSKLADKRSLTKNEKQRVIAIIEAHIEAVYDAWEYGYSDYVFKIGDTGFDISEKLILIDLGEMSSDKDFILHALKQRRWEASTRPEKKDFPQIPAELHQTYKEMMSKALTPSQLERRWRKKHICTQCEGSTGLRDFVAAKASEIDFIDRW